MRTIASTVLDLDAIEAQRQRRPARGNGLRIDRGYSSGTQQNGEENNAEAGNHGNRGLGNALLTSKPDSTVLASPLPGPIKFEGSYQSNFRNLLNKSMRLGSFKDE